MFVRVLLVLGLTAFFLSCFYDEHTGDAKPSGNESSYQALNSEDNNKNNSPVKVIGTFSNRDGNGEHEWGYEVDLWAHNGDVIGMFTGSAGTRLVGDPPTGILKDVMYNFDTGSISFRATLPNVDYEFEGVLSRKALSGRLFNMSGRLLSQRCDEAEKIVLLKSQELTTEMEEYATLDAWKERMSEIVRFRGVEGTVK
jgi:hypothetical protein